MKTFLAHVLLTLLIFSPLIYAAQVHNDYNNPNNILDEVINIYDSKQDVQWEVESTTPAAQNVKDKPFVVVFSSLTPKTAMLFFKYQGTLYKVHLSSV